MNTSGPWYTKSKADDRQGLIIDEKTGTNIAVSYDAAHAPIIAAAPDLLQSCEELSNWMRERTGQSDGTKEMLIRAMNAIKRGLIKDTR